MDINQAKADIARRLTNVRTAADYASLLRDMAGMSAATGSPGGAGGSCFAADVMNITYDTAFEVWNARVTKRVQIARAIRGCFEVRLVAPEWEIVPGYDPLRAIMMDLAPAEYLAASQTESGGSATATISASAGLFSRVRAMYHLFSQGVTQAAQLNAVATLTYSPERKNGELINDTQSGTTPFAVSDTTVTENALTYRFNEADLNGAIDLILAFKPAGLPYGLPDVALLKTPISGGLASSPTMATALTGLVSGSGVRISTVALLPGFPEWPTFVERTLSRYYASLKCSCSG